MTITINHKKTEFNLNPADAHSVRQLSKALKSGEVSLSSINKGVQAVFSKHQSAIDSLKERFETEKNSGKYTAEQVQILKASANTVISDLQGKVTALVSSLKILRTEKKESIKDSLFGRIKLAFRSLFANSLNESKDLLKTMEKYAIASKQAEKDDNSLLNFEKAKIHVINTRQQLEQANKKQLEQLKK